MDPFAPYILFMFAGAQPSTASLSSFIDCLPVPSSHSVGLLRRGSCIVSPGQTKDSIEDNRSRSRTGWRHKLGMHVKH